MERCTNRRGGDGAFVYRREISDRDLPRANSVGERIRRRRFSGRPVVLGLLLSANRLFWSGIYSDLRSTVWIGNPAAEICRAHRSEERHNLASLSHLPELRSVGNSPGDENRVEQLSLF